MKKQDHGMHIGEIVWHVCKLPIAFGVHPQPSTAVSTSVDLCSAEADHPLQALLVSAMQLIDLEAAIHNLEGNAICGRGKTGGAHRNRESAVCHQAVHATMLYKIPVLMLLK